jgi:hypothetical protein
MFPASRRAPGLSVSAEWRYRRILDRLLVAGLAAVNPIADLCPVHGVCFASVLHRAHLDPLCRHSPFFLRKVPQKGSGRYVHRSENVEAKDTFPGILQGKRSSAGQGARDHDPVYLEPARRGRREVLQLREYCGARVIAGAPALLQRAAAIIPNLLRDALPFAVAREQEEENGAPVVTRRIAAFEGREARAGLVGE